jgi:glycine C-acetyltransferase
MGRIDIITGTLGKALGGASGGFTSGRKEIIGWLRQRSRPYLFSNSVAPTIAATSIAVLDLLENDDHLRGTLMDNAIYFRTGLTELGFELKPGEHPTQMSAGLTREHLDRAIAAFREVGRELGILH